MERQTAQQNEVESYWYLLLFARREQKKKKKKTNHTGTVQKRKKLTYFFEADRSLRSPRVDSYRLDGISIGRFASSEARSRSVET